MGYVLTAHCSGRTYVRKRIGGKRAAEKWGKLAGLKFSDGSILHVAVREATPHERITPVFDPGYERMLDRAFGREGLVRTEEVGG